MLNSIQKMLLLSVALILMLSACGQKGPLYLPKEPAAPAATNVENPPPSKP